VPVGQKQFLFLVSQTPFFRAQRDARAGALPAYGEQFELTGECFISRLE
jgi:hypothetical protein